MKKIILLTGLILCQIQSLTAQNPLINNPSLNADGSKIAFNYQGDIWTSDVSGNFMQRITVHEAYDDKPLWSQDGKSIVFQSDRYGNNDLFIMSSVGGIPKRLTYNSANDYLTDYAKDGEILFSTSRNFRQIERDLEIQTIQEKGGTPFLKMNSLGSDAVFSPNKKFIAFVIGGCRIEREAYQGSANRDIWLYDIANDKYSKLTNFNGNDFNPKWGDDETIYYQSSKSGRYNVHRLKISEKGDKIGDDESITSFKDMGIFSFEISRNGKKIILMQGDKLFVVNPETKESKNIVLNLETDYLLDPIVNKKYTADIEEISVSPNSKNSAFVIRGEIFITENDKDKSRSVNVSNSPYRDRMITWLSDDKLVFVSDRDGQNDLYLLQSDDLKEKNLFKTLKRKIIRLTKTEEDESDPIISPDKSKVVFKKGRGKLVVATISATGSLSNQITLLDGWDTPSGVAWSPDSKWLAYSLSDLDFNEEVYIHRADNKQKAINVSMHPKTDRGPVWSPDGSKLAFSSNKNNGDYDVWFTWLKKEDWQKTKEDWDENDSGKDKKKDEDDDKDKEDKDKEVKKSVSPIVIDVNDIHKRQVQVTAFTGGEFVNGFSKDGETIFYTTGNGSRADYEVESDLYKIKWDGKDKEALTKEDKKPRDVYVDKSSKYAYYTSKGKLNRVAVKDGKNESLPINAVMDINYTEEANQIFEEAWSAINDGFYDPNFHGRDWSALKNTYKPLCMKASTRDDFKAMFNWMLGQINASHMGMYRGEDRNSVQKNSTGLLGLIVMPQKSGALLVQDVVENMPADREVSKLKKGDIITAVNGVAIEENTNFYSLLTNLSDEKIYLNVTSSDGAKNEIVIRPKSSNRKENYEDWVSEMKRLTEVYSAGKLGYIHIQGMNWTSFEEFERELTAAGLGKEGIVIDVRFNGGGWTTDYLMAVLTVRQHAYTIPRGASEDLAKEHQKFSNNYPYSERLPLSSWTKPSIALCNAGSYSNAEIFSHAYKNLGIGTLVGQPTFGAVISTGATGLIDGSIVRMPFRGWYVKASGENMDFSPAIPDILVENDPDGKAKGQDKQLKRAIEELLKQIK